VAGAQLSGTRVVVLARDASPGYVERCFQLGVEACLSRPFLPAELKDILLRGPARRKAADVLSPLPARLSAQSTRPGHRVLLVEDNMVNQRLAQRLLEKRDYTVEVAGDGCRALELLAESEFQFVLMDLQMPKLDGFETTAAIRAGEATTGRHLPIIAMTANAMKGDREKCLAAGMDAYISKPIQVEELFAALEQWAETRDRRDAAPIPNRPQIGARPGKQMTQ
jgi:CheY-like chemotaxis protein